MPDERATSASSSEPKGDELTPGRRGLLRRAKTGGIVTVGTGVGLLAAAAGVEVAPLVAHVVASTPEGLAAAASAGAMAATAGVVRLSADPSHHSDYDPMWRGHNPRSVMRRISVPGLLIGAGAAGAAVVSHMTGGLFGGDVTTAVFGTAAAASGTWGALGSAITARMRNRPGWSRGESGPGLE